jgi:hypothetical protein
MRRLQHTRSIGRAPAPVGPIHPAPPTGVEDAWRTLSLVLDLIKHAETKAGLTLSGSGVLGGVLLSIMAHQRRPSVALSIAGTLCAVLVTVAAAGAGMALRPVLRTRGSTNSLLFFMHIADGTHASVLMFANSFRTLVTNPSALVSEIATQIWENSHVARRKHLWNRIGTSALLLALAPLAMAALLGALT